MYLQVEKIKYGYHVNRSTQRYTMNRKEIMRNNHEIENYSWGIIQDMIEGEVNAAFKLRVDPVMPSKKEIKTIIRDTVKRERTKKQ